MSSCPLTRSQNHLSPCGPRAQLQKHPVFAYPCCVETPRAQCSSCTPPPPQCGLWAQWLNVPKQLVSGLSLSHLMLADGPGWVEVALAAWACPRGPSRQVRLLLSSLVWNHTGSLDGPWPDGGSGVLTPGTPKGLGPPPHPTPAPGPHGWGLGQSPQASGGQGRAPVQ